MSACSEIIKLSILERTVIDLFYSNIIQIFMDTENETKLKYMVQIQLILKKLKKALKYFSARTQLETSYIETNPQKYKRNYNLIFFH